MYIKIRKLGAPQGEKDTIINISKMGLIQELRELIFKETNVEIDHQLLLYKGKQLINDHKVVDYDIQLNDVIQLIVRKPQQSEKNSDKNKTEGDTKENKPEKKLVEAESKFYKRGDIIDVVIDSNNGAWYEAIIDKILKPEDCDCTEDESQLIFKVKSDENIVIPFNLEVSIDEIRPRSFYTYKITELKEGMIVLANYNIEDTKTRGAWFDFKIASAAMRNVKGTLLVGKDKTPLEDCTLKFTDEIMRIEPRTLISERTQRGQKKPPFRKYPYYCDKCKDVKTRKCRDCGCKICAGKDNIDTLILCDECDYGFHTTCLDPPLDKVPDEEEWYCPDCKTDDSEIVKAGEKLKISNKKKKMASSKNDSKRDWGKGMACVGRTKECTIVPKDHYGQVPGVEVGTCWKFRLQVSEAGIHRPHVAGIHGRETDGAYSLVLSGGYEDDIDNGEEFFYTGSGGRDLSGNKRVNDQSCDQKLTRMNKALAMNCHAKFNDKDGAEAVDWKAGKPVRVVRNYKLGKHSKYAPKDGNRYDGVYKVVKYYPEKGKSGFIVWRYLLRRDDPTPAPWEEGGQEFDMIYPPGYLEAQEVESKKENGNKSNKKSPTKGTKRKATQESGLKQLTDFFNCTPKKAKVAQYKLTTEVEELIEKDELNEKLWEECKTYIKDGKLKFLEKVEEIFMCICCQEVAYLPVTTECKHNICKSCLKRSFSAKIYTCPYCRFDLGEKYIIKVNETLSDTLKLLFPGYEATR